MNKPITSAMYAKIIWLLYLTIWKFWSFPSDWSKSRLKSGFRLDWNSSTTARGSKQIKCGLRRSKKISTKSSIKSRLLTIDVNIFAFTRFRLFLVYEQVVRLCKHSKSTSTIKAFHQNGHSLLNLSVPTSQLLQIIQLRVIKIRKV
jgi:hypothetical protein